MSLSKVDRQTGDLTTVAGTPSDAIQVAYNNATSGLAASNVQSAIDEVNARIPTAEVATTSPYTKLGFEIGCPPGLLRSRTEPVKTVLFLGNSLVGCHLTYTTTDGRSVDELREVGATRPNSGWVGLSRDYLASIYPDIKVYKTNAAIWEQTTHAAGRSYNLIKDLEIYEVTDNGSFEVPGLTVDDVLKEADIVSIHLCTNIGDCTTNANVPELVSDFQNLFDSMKAVNANAYYSLSMGYSYNTQKRIALYNVATNVPFVNGWETPVFIPAKLSDYYCGEEMQYGIDGSEVGNITPAASTHPSDYAYYQMAVNWLFSIFNSTYKDGLNVYTPQSIPDAAYGTYSIFNPPANSSLDPNTWASDSDDPIADYYVIHLPGVYKCGMKLAKITFVGTAYLAPCYGSLNITSSGGTGITMEFTGIWGNMSCVTNGFILNQCLLYSVDPEFNIYYGQKWVNNNTWFSGIHDAGGFVDANNVMPYHPRGFKKLSMPSGVITFVYESGDSNFPSIAGHQYIDITWSPNLGTNQGSQTVYTTNGQCYMRFKGLNTWSAWKQIND